MIVDEKPNKKNQQNTVKQHIKQICRCIVDVFKKYSRCSVGSKFF